jgi:hypothetical protein
MEVRGSNCFDRSLVRQAASHPVHVSTEEPPPCYDSQGSINMLFPST